MFQPATYVTFLEILCCNQVATAPFVAPNASSLVKHADLGKVGLAEGIKFGIKFLDSLAFS